MTLDGRYRINVKISSFVKIQETDGDNSILIEGIVKEIITKRPFHNLGILVELENGVKGRVKEIPEKMTDVNVLKKTSFELVNHLEIELRKLIVKCLSVQENWWKTLPADVRENAEQRAERDSKVQKTMRMNKHAKIDQIDFADLERILIKKDFWKLYFKDIFLDQNALSVKLKEIAMMRNHIDHSKSLSRENEERLRIYCKDIFEMIKNSDKL